MRWPLTLLSVLLLPACSLFSPEDRAPLALEWSNTQYAQGEVSGAMRGAVSANHFYAMVRRVGLAAFNRADGSLVWHRSVEGPCSPPVYADGRVFCPADRLFAFDAASGQPLWTADLGAFMQLAEGTADAEAVYVGLLYDTSTQSDVAAVDAATGAVRWRKTLTGPGWYGARMRSLALSPEGDLIASFDATFPPRFSRWKASALVAFDPATGEERWRYVDGDERTERGAGGVTFWADLLLYSGGHDAGVVALDRATRAVRWRAPTTPGYLSPYRPPQVADGVAYYSDGYGGVFAVDAATGARRWAATLDGGTWSQEVCGPYFLGHMGPIGVVERARGRSRGWLLSRDDYAGPVAVADGVAYVVAESGVYAFRCEG